MKKNNFFHREEKEKWVRSKYELKEFVPSPPYLDVPLPQVVFIYLFCCFLCSNTHDFATLSRFTMHFRFQF